MTNGDRMSDGATPGGVPLPLQSPLRPDPIPDLQQAYLTSIEVQLLVTVLLVGLVALGLTFGRRLEMLLSDRYGTQIAEGGRILWLLVVIVAGVYLFSVIWHVTFMLRIVLETLAFDRWTAIQQLVTVSVVLIAYLLMRFVNRSIDKLAENSSITEHQSEVAYHVADVGIAAGATTVILTVWGVNLTNIFIGAGAITAIVGLAARETLAAMIAGFVLLFSRPFRVGDWIAVDTDDEENRSGIVTDVTIFNTKIQTFSDEYVLIPNDEITSSQLKNLSRNDQLRVEVEVGVDYTADIEHARDVMVDAVSDLESIKSSPNPKAVAKRFGDSSIVLELRIWIGDPTMRRKWRAQTDAIEAIKAAFDREGITIPYPQRVHAPRDGEEGFRVDANGPEPVDPPETDD
jgi:small conductance mechanosensitive channel